MPAFAALHVLVLAALGSAPARDREADAALLVGTALGDGVAFARLAELTDLVGPRLSGSPGAAAAVDWAARRFREDGLLVRLEPVKVPHWVRGEERAELLAPGIPRPLAITALGGSPATPAGGIAAEVVEAESLEAVRALGGAVRGRIVLFQHAMGPGKGSYAESVALRGRGPAEAASAGAAAALVRSLATASLRSPHTGETRFSPGGPRIPAAAIAVEDAELLHRLLARGPVKVRIALGCGLAEPAEVESANVVAEVRGRERPEEVVLVGAHLDSWDLGAGAADDAAGVAMVMEAVRLAARMARPPRRTMRAVLFMNEENGLAGGLAYAERHRAELPKHVVALEADAGAGRPTGVRFAAGEGGGALVARLAAPLAGLGAASLTPGEGGADISPLRYERVPVVEMAQDTSHYFDVHHSAADTLDKVDPTALAAAAAALAAMAWGLADAEEVLPRPDPPARPPWWRAPPAPQAR
jgi:hypothetical protein